ncbi:hypothetical protein [Chryseobacterium sp. MYb7]|uniref:hypothetical protein n=1 Tax=Chryseobacterium sp. MYb7 TaxID=1827290 RepID=UPI0013FE3296|nr:hypothetical protein [Chryseobacterium sp. MYb7]
MKSFLIPILLFSLSCKENNTKAINGDKINLKDSMIKVSDKNFIDISGKWKYVKKDQNSTVPEEMFTLNIIQTDNNIKAQYCAIANSGGKIDCENDIEYNVKGTVNRGKIIVDFYSFFSSQNDKGKAEIIINNDGTLKWKIIKSPQGQFYSPDECILQRESKTENAQTNSASKQLLPFDYKDIGTKIQLEAKSEKNIEILFKQKYQLGIDAMTKLPSNGNYDLYIISNISGDSELMYLITTKNGKLIDGLEISNSNGVSEEVKVFSINENYEVSIYSEKNSTKKLTELYLLNDKGVFNKKTN